MRMFEVAAFVSYLVFVAGCASQQVSTTTSSSARHNEDLSFVRPKVEFKKDTVVVKPAEKTKSTTYVEPKFAVNDKLDMVLDSIDRINLSRKYVEGYTIQVYSGKREDALNTRKQLTSLLPEIKSDVQFTEPIFRVKAGKYYNWIDAQADFTLIKKYFPAAIIIPDKISINNQ